MDESAMTECITLLRGNDSRQLSTEVPLFGTAQVIALSGAWKPVTLSEAMPITLLIVEAILGICVNFIALLLYWSKPAVPRNVGNIFTVNLMVNDLVLCGVGVPTTVAIRFLQPGTPHYGSNLCFANRAILMLCGIASAAATALLALDRADISLRASKRFFVKRRPFVAIAIMWLMSLTTTLVPVLSMLHYSNVNDVNKALESPLSSPRNETATTLVISANNTARSCEAQCSALCSSNFCVMTKAELEVQLGFQILMFGLCVLLTFFVYMKILWYVHQRSSRQSKKKTDKKDDRHRALTCSPGHRTNALLRNYVCCTWIKHEKKDRSPCETELLQRPPSGQAVGDNVSSANDRTAGNRDLERDVRAGEKSPLRVNQDANTASPGRAQGRKPDFAAIVSVVMAIRRMREKNIIARKKRLRHLRKMTVLILFSFSMCWIPFHLLPVVKYLCHESPATSTTCVMSQCTANGTSLGSGETARFLDNGTEHFFDVFFLWSMVCAAASGTLNPILYSFSREKVRQALRSLCCERRRHKEVKAVVKATGACGSRGRQRQSAAYSNSKAKRSSDDCKSNGGAEVAKNKSRGGTTGHEASEELLQKTTLRSSEQAATIC